MANYSDRVRELLQLVQSIKRTVEDSNSHIVAALGRDAWMRIILALEEARILIRHTTELSRPLEQKELDVLRIIHGKLTTVTSDDANLKALRHVQLRHLARNDLNYAHHLRKMSVSDAIFTSLNIIDDISRSPVQQAFDLDVMIDFDRLTSIVPDQKVAPVQFGMDGGKIVVRPQRHQAPVDEITNIEAARSHLHSSGRNIVNSLHSSNCDRRLIDAIEGLQSALVQPDNVIQLGLTNLGVEAICNTAKDELPDAIFGMVTGHVAAVAMFVAQFPEWQRFSDNAASVNLAAEDIEEINNAASAIISQIETRPEIADSEVPKTIKAIRNLTRDPKTTARRAAFALLRTLENFVSTVFNYGKDFISKTATKASDELSSLAAKTAAGALIAAALAGAGQMTGVTDRISEAGWIRNAAEIFQRQASKAE